MVDVTLAEHPVAWAAGGTPHTVFPTTYVELLRTCGRPSCQRHRSRGPLTGRINVHRAAR